METTEELKLCPCCSGKAQSKCKQGSWGYTESKYYVECGSCGLSTKKFRDDEHFDRTVNEETGYQIGWITDVKGFDKAIKAWNTRS